MLKALLTFLLAASLGWQQSSNVSARFNRAVALQQEGRLAEAAAEYRALLTVKPDYAEAQANLGVVLAQLGNYQEAIAAYKEALRLAPRLTPILLNLGICYYRAGQFAQAVEAFEKLLAIKPDALQARQLLGISLVELGRDLEAITQLEQTLKEAPQDAAVLYNLGLAYLRAGTPGLRSTLERLASFSAGLPALHLLQGQAFLANQEWENALEELQRAEKLNPELPRLHYWLGLAHFNLRHNKEAIAAFEKEFERNQKHFLTLYYLANLQEAEGNLSAARQYIDAALSIEQQSAEANALLSKILVKQGKEVEAIAPLERAVAKDPNDPTKRYMLARLYRQLGRQADADREFAEVQRLKAEQLKRDRARVPKP